MVNERAWAELKESIRDLSAGKVAKPATLDKPSAAANQVEAHTAVEAAEPAPADPLAQAMELIPNTYDEGDNDICAAISNMLNDMDRMKRAVDRLTGNDVLDRVCQSCRAALKASLGKGDIPGVVKTNQS